MSYKMIFIVLLIQQTFVCYSFIHAQNNDIKNNVLFVIVDDLRHLSVDNVNLPNLSKLSERGANFKYAYSQQALCAPSRNSLLTSRRPDTLRLYDFYSYWRSTVGNFTTIPQYFKDNGYDTFSVGKVFHPGKSSNYTDDYPLSWTNIPYHPPTQRFKDSAVCKSHMANTLESDLICPVNVKHQPDQSLPDLQSLDYAINILKSQAQRKPPFFLAIGFQKPHIPLKFPRKYLHNIPISSISMPKFPKKPQLMPPVSWHPWTDVRGRDDIRRLNISFPFGIMPKKWTLKIRQSYYAAVTYIDNLIGELINHVDMNKTIIVVTSDHGWSLGENGLWAKYSNFDVALRVPLIFVAPGLAPRIIEDPVELVDIFPTLVDLANIKRNIPQCKNTVDKILCFEGKSLISKMIGHEDEESYAISQYPRPSSYPKWNSDKPHLKQIKIMGYSIRTKTYRYTEWVSFNNTSFKINWDKIYGLELYDHIIDPEEHNNLYLALNYTNIRNKLSKFLRSHVDELTLR